MTAFSSKVTGLAGQALGLAAMLFFVGAASGCMDVPDPAAVSDDGTPALVDAGSVVVVPPPSDGGMAVVPDAGGDSCPICPLHSQCQGGSTCVCDEGFFPNADGTRCTTVGRGCSSGRAAYCVNGDSVFCDPINGVSVLDCASFGGTCDAGMCTCGALLHETDPMCVDGPARAHEYKVGCDLRTGHLRLTNCREYGTTGHCATMVTAFGHATECWCSPGVVYSLTRDACEAVNRCDYEPNSSTYLCP